MWHKEILLALEDGIAVYGASSMGARRAAELERFGMVGVGRVFEGYRDGIYTDDDEVTLVHGRGAERHVALSDPMVNIRATLERAVREGVIRAASAERVLDQAKGTFYKERSLEDAVARALSAAEPGEPFMLQTCQVRSPLDLPAITHVDGSARVQTVSDAESPRFAALLREFDRRTGCPIVLNTSFNVRGEPIVCTPRGRGPLLRPRWHRRARPRRLLDRSRERVPFDGGHRARAAAPIAA